MSLKVAFFAFGRHDSGAKEMNSTLARVRERFASAGSRIINVETVPAETLLWIVLSPGGLRVWYESEATIAGD